MSFKRFLSALFVSSGMIGAASAQDTEPAQAPKLLGVGTASVASGLPPSNQHLADAVARRLKESRRLQRYRIYIQVSDGEVELAGVVLDWSQREEAIQQAKSVAGVTQVRDRLHIGKEGAIVPVQAIPIPEQGPDPQRLIPPLPPGAYGPSLPPVQQGFPQDPAPIAQVPSYDPLLQPPPMPPYAWPTYAPYNNLSRVAYPDMYPYESWPFIGPFYPFPKVPPGWRSVTLTWNDGFWWYGKNATGHDWWRIRYR